MSYLGVTENTSSLLDIDFSGLEEAACEYPVDCDKSADWVLILSCGCKVLVCDPHKSEELSRMKNWLSIVGPYNSTCVICGGKRRITAVSRAERI